MPTLLAFLGPLVAKVFGDKLLGWIAMKALLVFLFLTIVPLILNNFLYDVIEIFINLVAGHSSGLSALNGSMSFSGFAAWLMECFRVPEAFSLLISALCLRLVLNMIPFVRLVG